MRELDADGSRADEHHARRQLLQVEEVVVGQVRHLNKWSRERERERERKREKTNQRVKGSKGQDVVFYIR